MVRQKLHTRAISTCTEAMAVAGMGYYTSPLAHGSARTQSSGKDGVK